MVLVVLALGSVSTGVLATAAYAAGSFPGAQSDWVEIEVQEPIGLELFLSSQEKEVDADRYLIVPGKELLFDYRITNISDLDYVVGLRPVFEGDNQDIAWKLRAVGSEYQFEANPNGPAHLLVQAEGVYHVVLALSFPRNAPTGLTSFIFNVRRTDCTEVEGCPWG